MARITKEEHQHGKPGVKYGIWNTVKKKWQFDICEETPMLAEARLFQKIGDDARKHRFEVKRYPASHNKPNSGVHLAGSEFGLTETQKEWLRQLYLNAAEEHKGAASNCHIAALGSEGEEAGMFELSAEENRDFAIYLESLARRVYNE